MPSPPINHVTLCLLGKACLNASDAGIVAGKPEVVASLVRLWLGTTETAVAQKAFEVFSHLLEVDYTVRTLGEEKDIKAFVTDSSYKSPRGQGLMWRRVFHDRDIYGLIFSLCSLSTAGQDGLPSKRETTVAQARLLELVGTFASSTMITSSQLPEVETVYGVKDGGLLEFAAVHMVDYKDDVLMHMNLIDFFAAYLGHHHADFLALNSQCSADTSNPFSSPTLDFLIKKGLHARTVSYYLEPDKHESMDVAYLYSRSANYISVYASHCSTHLLHSPSIADPIMQRLTTVLSQMSNSKWAHGGNVSQHDLHVLVSLPRAVLLPRAGRSSPLFLIPAKPANAEALRTLMTIFRGPDHMVPGEFVPPQISAEQENPDLTKDDRRAARALYFVYLEQFPDFWVNIVNTAETVALKENALAAIGLMGAIIVANWETLPTSYEPTTIPFPLPTEDHLASKCHSQALPPSGILAILASPALEVVLPYLLRPAQTFTNLVGGRGDSESAAYKVAAAKYDVLILLHQKLQDVAQDGGSLQDLVHAVGRRVAQGPLGGTSDVGGRIGTMEL